MHTDIYKWLTKTSGLALMEQARKLMYPPAVKSESETTARVEEWVGMCDRLAKYGAQYGLPALLKTAALRQTLMGETRREFGVWTMYGLPYGKLFV